MTAWSRKLVTKNFVQESLLTMWVVTEREFSVETYRKKQKKIPKKSKHDCTTWSRLTGFKARRSWNWLPRCLHEWTPPSLHLMPWSLLFHLLLWLWEDVQLSSFCKRDTTRNRSFSFHFLAVKNEVTSWQKEFVIRTGTREFNKTIVEIICKMRLGIVAFSVAECYKRQLTSWCSPSLAQEWSGGPRPSPRMWSLHLR